VQAPNKKTGRLQKGHGANLAQRTAAEYCLLNYPTLYTAGYPRPGSRPDLWIVPIVVVRPHGEVVGTVGDLTIDIAIAKIVEATSKQAVLAAGRELARVDRNGAKAAPEFPARKRG
jgi:hypothetical protein